MSQNKPLKTQCCVCTKVLRGNRDKAEDWKHEPHSYSHDYSHGYCPPCLKVELKKIDEYISTR